VYYRKQMSKLYDDDECVQCEINEYDNSVIYKLVCNDLAITDIYVGSTKCPEKRFGEHRSRCNNPKARGYNYNVYKFIRDNGGIDNWHEVIIEFVECSNKSELFERERFFKNKLGANLNSKEPFLTPDEVVYKHAQCVKVYDQSHKEQKRAYNQAHKEQRNAYYRAYYKKINKNK